MDLSASEPRQERNMAQQTLHRYFPSFLPPKLATPSEPRTTLLGVPTSVRTLIYRHAGLVPLKRSSKEPMMMNDGDITAGWCQYSEYARARTTFQNPAEKRLENWEGYSICCIHCGAADIYYEHGSQCLGPCCFACRLDGHDKRYDGNFPHQLFFVCRRLNEECTRLFYSEVRLQVVYTAPRGLGPLKRLGPLAIASLHDLTIRLNVCSCTGGPRCTLPHHRRANCYSTCRIGGHDEPLGRRPGCRYDRYAWQNLRDVCAHLACFLPANQLRFAFVCEVGDYGLAVRLMEALLQLPTLQSCTIALSLASDPRLRALAQETQTKLTNSSLARVDPRHFRLRHLPREIQLEILRCSDLVAPFHVLFAPKANQPARVAPCCIHKEAPRDFETVPVMCCCAYNAHSSSAWTCNHWHFPNSLFLVDRQMEKDARAIMYAQNDWLWTDITSLVPAWSNRSSSPLQSTLRRMRGNLSRFLANVRHLQIQVPCRVMPEKGELLQLLTDDLSRLLEKCVLEKLRLTLALRHPVHSAESINLKTFLASKAWRDQQLILRSIAAGLHGRHLRELVVGFNRLHVEIDEEIGYPYTVDCHIGEFLDRLEIKIEYCDLLGTQFPPQLQLRHLGAPKVPVKIHSHYEWVESQECLACSGPFKNGLPSRRYYDSIFFYHS